MLLVEGWDEKVEMIYSIENFKRLVESYRDVSHELKVLREKTVSYTHLTLPTKRIV